MKLKANEVKGFNYQPSYSSCTFETWRCFDFEIISKELERGKKFFPNFNTVRVWLSWNAFCRGDKVFLANFEKFLQKAASLDIMVMPVIFNRWHDPLIDCDGIYLEHFLPKASWITKYDNIFEKYLKGLMENFGKDERILCWDLCNEPFSYQPDFAWKEEAMEYERLWLKKMYDDCKRFGATQPIGIGEAGNVTHEYINDMSDVFLTHLYFRPSDPYDEEKIARFDALVKLKYESAKALGKELITNETGWGDLTEERRVQRLKVTLDTLTKYGIGYTLYALQNSDFTDLHEPSEGAVDPEIGNLCFIQRDGTLRKGHDIVNKY